MFDTFFEILKGYSVEVIPSVLLGFFLSGLVHELVPKKFIDTHLSQKGLKPIFYLTIVGIFLPICCFGSLPMAIGFRKRF